MLPKRLKTALADLKRRQGWLLEGASPGQLANLGLAGASYATGSEGTLSYPAILKLDISPMCNLSCTVCVHAKPNGNEALEKQDFNARQRMSVEQFQRIVDEVKGKTSALSLYYLGDPLVHPELPTMCRIGRDAGMRVHVSTNFSFALSDDRIKRLTECGITHFTACVDGLSQEKYEKTRVGGKIKHVLSNLERMLDHRAKMGAEYPKVEVQYIKFQHNLDEEEEAIQLFNRLGVDQVTRFWGSLHNYTDLDPGTFVLGEAFDRKALPHCYWPYFSMVIRYDGDVIPCCSYRLGQQYTAEHDRKVLGNVFTDGVKKVWDSTKYRQARKLSTSPKASDNSAELKEHFCYSCPALFNTTKEENTRTGRDYRWEELYQFGDRGRVEKRKVGS